MKLSIISTNYRMLSLTLQVEPVVIYVSSVVSVLFYWGVMQYVIRKMAWVMQFTMATTAAESLSAVANIFIGTVRMLFVHVAQNELDALQSISKVKRTMPEWA